MYFDSGETEGNAILVFLSSGAVVLLMCPKKCIWCEDGVIQGGSTPSRAKADVFFRMPF